MNILSELSNLDFQTLLDLYFKIRDLQLEHDFESLPTLLHRVDKKFLPLVYDPTPHQKKFLRILRKFLIQSEKSVINRILKLKSSELTLLMSKYSKIRFVKRYKIVRKNGFEWVKNTFPVKYFQKIDYEDVEILSRVDIENLTLEMTAAAIETAQKSAEFTANKMKLPPVNIRANYAEFYAQRIRSFTSAVEENLQSRIKAEIIESLKYGESREQLVRRIQQVFKEPILVRVAPLKDREGNIIRKGYSYQIDNKRWANMVAATEVSFAVNNGRLQEMESSGVVARVRWVVVSSRPCPDCAMMNGRVFTFSEAKGLIPYHVHCYCTWEIAEYKRVEDPLPTLSEFPPDLYANPNGLGLMEMMKMSPAELARFTQLLDSGKIDEAKKLLARHHSVEQRRLTVAHNFIERGIVSSEQFSEKDLKINWTNVFSKSLLKESAMEGISSVNLVKTKTFSEAGKHLFGKYDPKKHSIKIVSDPKVLCHTVCHHIYRTKLSETQKKLVERAYEIATKQGLSQYKLVEVEEFFATTGEYMISKTGREQIRKHFGKEYYDLLSQYFEVTQ